MWMIEHTVLTPYPQSPNAFSPSRPVLLLRAAVVAVAFVLLSCGSSPTDAKPSSPPILALITIDTLRADHLGCYGNATARTPTLDALARDGVLFTTARTVAPVTLPAHASLMTGQYPPRHGVRDNGLFQLPASARTLAEILGERGWE